VSNKADSAEVWATPAADSIIGKDANDVQARIICVQRFMPNPHSPAAQSRRPAAIFENVTRRQISWYGSRHSLADLGDLGAPGESGALVVPA
jgi:hypothetical protein